MRIAMIAAMANNRVIGKDNQMPWHLPADLHFFKQSTLGKPVIMGRKTYESIGRTLPGRQNIIVTRNVDFEVDGATVVHSVERALEVADACEEIIIIGGSHLYEQMLDRVDRLYLTFIEADLEGDVFFPDFTQLSWREISHEHKQADEKNPYNMRFMCMERVR